MLSIPTRSARGLTLIELAVTMTVVAMMLFVALPSVGTWIRNTQVRNTASSMTAGLNLARSEAIRRNVAIRFSLVSQADSANMSDTCALSGSGVSWVVSVRDPSGRCTFAPTNVAAIANDPLIVQSNAGGVGGRNVVVSAKLADGSAAADTVTFDGFGRVADVAPIGFINISNVDASNDYRRLRIEVNPGGSARLCDLAVTSTTDSRYCPTRGTP